MRKLEIRRHSIRSQAGQHLSQEGVSLARKVGSETGPFDLVVTSVLPRAFETAIAMGFAVDKQDEQLNTMGDDVTAEIHWTESFGKFARVIKEGGITARFANEQAEFWKLIAQSLPEDGKGLIITHGGIIESGAVACLPEALHVTWGQSCSYCEGIRLSFENGKFTDGEILRVR
jgi:broad specificity phosphatase PhoE